MNSLIKKLSTTALIATIFTACGGGGSASFDDGTTTTKVSKINLVAGEKVIVNVGDKVSAQNEETQIKIEHILGKDIKSITLLKGEATLIYGDFSLSLQG